MQKKKIQISAKSSFNRNIKGVNQWRVKYHESMFLTMAIAQDVMTMKVRSVALADHYILPRPLVFANNSIDQDQSGRGI